MAAQAQKKQTASGSRKKTTTGTSAKSSRKKSTGSSKQSAAKRKKAERYQAETDSQIFHEIGLLLLFALMAFFFLCNFGILGPAGNSISGFMFGMFGASAYILPIALFVGVAFWMANEGYPAAARKLAAGAVLFLMFGVVCDLVVKEAASMTESVLFPLALPGEGRNDSDSCDYQSGLPDSFNGKIPDKRYP